LSSASGERAFIERLRRLLPAAPTGQQWIGDDAAVLDDGLLLKTDVMVEGIHFDLSWCDPEDVGWKALAVNLSDIAAMAGAPVAAVVALVVPPDRPGMAESDDDRTGDRREPTRVSHRRRGHLERIGVDGRSPGPCSGCRTGASLRCPTR